MPGSLRSNEWLLDSDTRLKPNVLRASIACGGERKRPSFGDWPFLSSRTVDSKLVNTTSPLTSDVMIGTADGACARISDRIIDCPVKVILSTGGWARRTPPVLGTMTRQVAANRSRPRWQLVPISVILQAGILGHT